MRILIVDDSRAMRMIVARTLKKAGFEGHTIEEASNGQEALDAIQASPPDLVLTDWNMPEMSGIELVRAVGEQGLSVKIGMVTSQATAEVRQEAKEAGALFLLSKPFTPDTLRGTLGPYLS